MREGPESGDSTQKPKVIVVWRPCGGFELMAVDNGEHRLGKYKASPVLVPNGYFDAKRIHSAFAKECTSLPQEFAAYVLHALERYPSYGGTL